MGILPTHILGLIEQTYPCVFTARERPSYPDVEVRAFVGELCWEDVARFDVGPHAVDHGPRDPVSVEGAQLPDATRHQVQLSRQFVQSVCNQETKLTGFIFVHTMFVQKEKCSLFLKLTPTPRDRCLETTRHHKYFRRLSRRLISARSFGVIFQASIWRGK